MTSEAGARRTTRDFGRPGTRVAVLVSSFIAIVVGGLLVSSGTSVAAVVGGGLVLAGLLALAGAWARRRRPGVSQALLWLALAAAVLAGLAGLLVWAFSSQPEAVDAAPSIARL